MKGRAVRPAVSWSSTVLNAISSQTSRTTLLRCQYAGRNSRSQAMSSAVIRPASSSQPPRAARSGFRTSSPSAWMRAMSTSVTLEPMRTMTWPWTMSSTTGATAAARRSRSCCVRSAENELFGTSSGAMSSAARVRSPSVSCPAICDESRWRAWATSVSRSSVRSVTSSTRVASVRTGVQRSGFRVWRTVAASLDSAGRTESMSAWRSAAVVVAENAVSSGPTFFVKAATCSAAIVIARSVVKSYCGSTARRACSRAASVRTSLV